MDLRSLIENDVQAEVSKAKASPDQLERHIRSAFMNGMVLGARLQTKLPDATTDEMAGAGGGKRRDAQRLLPKRGVALGSVPIVRFRV